MRNYSILLALVLQKQKVQNLTSIFKKLKARMQGTNQITIDISTLENGVYFITTRNTATNDIIRTVRFFKQ